MITVEDIHRIVHLKDKDKQAFSRLLHGKAPMTADDIERLMLLKAADKELFYRILEELRHMPRFTKLLSYKKFKEYASNV